MQEDSNSSNSKLFTRITVFPFIVSVVLLLIGLIFLMDISLLPPFSFNFKLVMTLTVIHFVIIITFIKQKNIKITLREQSYKKLKNSFLLFLLFCFTVASSFLLVISLKMNLNYLFKNNLDETILLSVENKYISRGRATDYYVVFHSEIGKYNLKVSPSRYDNFEIGETFYAEVNKGYFEGYFLKKKLK